MENGIEVNSSECNISINVGRMWYQDDFYTFIVTIYSVLSIVIFCLNGVVIVAYLSEPKLMKLSFNVYVIHLTVSDFLIGSLFIPVQLILFSSNGSDEFHWLYLELRGTFLYTSVFIIVIMGIDRLRLVMNPLKYSTTRSTKRNHLCAGATWIFSALFAAIYLISEKLANHLKLSCLPQDQVSFSFMVLLPQFLFNFIFPFGAITMVNILFILLLRKRLLSARKQSEMYPRKFSIKKKQKCGPCRFSTKEQGRLKVKATKEADKTVQEPSKKLTDTPEHITKVDLLSVTTQQFNKSVFKDKGVSDIKTKKLQSAAKKLFAFVLAYIFCWLPYYLCIIINLSFGQVSNPVFWKIALVFIYSNSAINPLMSLSVNRKLQRRVKEMFRRSLPQTMEVPSTIIQLNKL